MAAGVGGMIRTVCFLIAAGGGDDTRPGDSCLTSATLEGDEDNTGDGSTKEGGSDCWSLLGNRRL